MALAVLVGPGEGALGSAEELARAILQLQALETEELLAGATLTQEQDRDVVLGNEAGLGDGALDGRTRAEDGIEGFSAIGQGLRHRQQVVMLSFNQGREVS